MWGSAGVHTLRVWLNLGPWKQRSWGLQPASAWGSILRGCVARGGWQSPISSRQLPVADYEALPGGGLIWKKRGPETPGLPRDTPLIFKERRASRGLALG